ncbi:MAG: sulfite exporter TauE/SafE family protein [Acidobacteriota bacterium]|nr:sulfite exporter TauE/SafE family protein [Acidobacteriota bacterium]
MNILLVPLAGFLGSFHCAAMCGPFIGYCSAGRGGSDLTVHTAYQAGRLVAYAALGTLAGILGQGMLFAGEVVQAQKAVLIGLGVLMIGTGLWHYLPTRFRPKPGKGSRKLMGFVFRTTGRVEGPEGAALIGLLSALLPCGYLYGFVALALAAGGPLPGMATMVGVWLGTLPALLGAAYLARTCSRRFLNKLSGLTPAVLILLGILAILGKSTAFPDMIGGPHCFDLWASVK